MRSSRLGEVRFGCRRQLLHQARECHGFGRCSGEATDASGHDNQSGQSTVRAIHSFGL
jgi:hypothetical protein